MKRLSKVAKRDWKYVPVDPDPGFSPEHNKRVIEETIKKNDDNLRRIMKDHDGKIQERTGAAAMYLKRLEQGRGESDITKYFGDKELVKLRSEKDIYKLKNLIGNVRAKA